ncbi:MAG: biotin synthase [Proteobacteria bacterium]|nr:biotin synthase [Pseudomonadota bacterium]
MPNEHPPTIDPVAAARWAHAAPALSPWLHEEVARRMEQRLDVIRAQPARWAHWGAVRGGLGAHALLARRYRGSECFVVEADDRYAQAAMKAIAKPWWHPTGWRTGALHFEAPPAAGVQMVWANMALHEAAAPEALIGQWHRMLATDGFLMFSCLGPDTLRELRALYAALGWPPPGHEFTDMHDWGDMLLHAGFAEPVMDMERIRLTYATPARLLQDLRELGRNLHPARFAALRGRGWRERLEQTLAMQLADPADEGRLALTFEVVYGHALKPAPRVPVRPETRVKIEWVRDALHHTRSVDGT